MAETERVFLSEKLENHLVSEMTMYDHERLSAASSLGGGSGSSGGGVSGGGTGTGRGALKRKLLLESAEGNTDSVPWWEREVCIYIVIFIIMLILITLHFRLYIETNDRRVNAVVRRDVYVFVQTEDCQARGVRSVQCRQHETSQEVQVIVLDSSSECQCQCQ